MCWHVCFIRTSMSETILSDCPSAAICHTATNCNEVLAGRISLCCRTTICASDIMDQHSKTGRNTFRTALAALSFPCVCVLFYHFFLKCLKTTYKGGEKKQASSLLCSNTLGFYFPFKVLLCIATEQQLLKHDKSRYMYDQPCTDEGLWYHILMLCYGITCFKIDQDKYLCCKNKLTVVCLIFSRRTTRALCPLVPPSLCQTSLLQGSSLTQLYRAVT